ncbi:peptidase T [Fusobacterium russii]|uniref:peptidase T n=1 Tax=Fusobacterium russii TaxID=854 RepID=UPI00039FE013|nr:peptidase T [Fusobacterium russii]
MEKMLERFLEYIKYDTKSDEQSETCPSTSKQLILGKKLVEDLLSIGLKDARIDKNGYVYASLPANVEGAKKIGLIAHMDTAPDLDGKCINPKVFKYEGGDIVLNDTYTTTVKEFPFLKELVGQTLITTDGTTLLGADDKAGIVIIMEVLSQLVNNPNILHGDIKVGFTPDEEIGRGADLFDVEGFGADFAYTVDGGPIGELEYENFNAASADIKIQGKNVHPGSAKNIMLNSIKVAMELDSMLPANERPEYTEGYEGFYLLDELKGSVDYTEMSYIIRDHDMNKFIDKKELLNKAVDFLNKKYNNAIKLEIKDSYYNMKEKILPHFEIVELAKKSIEEAGVNPIIVPVRGGTDGARLSYMGLPTPNIFTGGYNYHGRYELISYDAMKKSVESILNIIKNNVKDKN